MLYTSSVFEAKLLFLKIDPFINDFEVDITEAIKIDNILEFDQYLECKRSFKIFHNNIQSIAKNIDELNVHLNQFNDKFEGNCPNRILSVCQ